ncbi:ATP synthase subunit delta' [Abeliophyllum distichum]|uniref:ATP synthase subunit delta n=1 Tax=Abeliophyllum distichum TaxID=126358 RepID=A0ABD1PED7_9LAMI
MIRRATTGLLSRSTVIGVYHRQLSSIEVSAADELFMMAWKRIMPNLDPPKTPLAFMRPRPSSIASKLTVNLVSPYSEFSNKEVDMVIVPATTGQMGILPGHMASISELKPGVLSIHDGNDVKKYFVSSGFAFIHSNSVVDIMAAEAVPIEQVDPASVQKQFTEFTQKLRSASTDLEKAEAQIRVDVLVALNSALSG